MKFVIASLLALSLVGCAGRTEYGECIGIDGHENPKYEYNYSVRNVVIGTIFFETIIVPAIVVFSELKCPVGTR